MKPADCEFEAEALAAALQSRWPERVDAALRAHVAGCAICSDVVAVAGAIDAARERMGVAVPDSGQVWWRAQLRARREAAEAAGRPITAIQAIAFACAVGLLVACFDTASQWFQPALGWIASNAAEHAALLLATAAVVLLLPAAVYLAMGRD